MPAMSIWRPRGRIDRGRNVVLVFLFFAVLVFTAYCEGYQSRISLPFGLLLLGGFAMSLWLAMCTSTIRLLTLMLSIFLIEYVKETIGIKSNLWAYKGNPGQYVFGVLAWVVAGTSAYGLATRVLVPVLRRLGATGSRWLNLAGPRWLNSVVLSALFALLPLTLGHYWTDIKPPFWAFYGLLLVVALLAARRTPFLEFAALVISAWLLGNLGEWLGSTHPGVWTFRYNPDYPPVFLVFACWPLEIFVQYSLSGFLAGELPRREVAPVPAGIDKSPEERALQFFLILSGAVYFAVGFAIALVPDWILEAINTLLHALIPSRPSVSSVLQERFWVALSFSMMMTITALCFLAARDVRRYSGYIMALLIAKAASALSGLAFCVFPPHSLPGLVVCLVDGSIFWITLFFFLRFVLRTQAPSPVTPPPSPGLTTVASIHGHNMIACLHEVLAETDFFGVLERRFEASRAAALAASPAATPKTRAEFSVVIKPNFMFMHAKEDRSTYTDPKLVEELIDRIFAKGFTNISVVEAQSTYGNYYDNRDVVTVAEYVGYSQSKNYRIVDLTNEMVEHDYGGRLGKHFVGRTWRDADFRVSFAKNKTHMFSNYTLTLKNVYGTFPPQNKLKEYHTERDYDWPTIQALKDFPVDFGLIDAFISADGQFGVIADPKPNLTQTIIAGENLLAVDWVGAKKMGLDPDDPSVGRFLPLVVQAFGKPEIHWVGNKSTYEDWHNVVTPLSRALNLIEKSYAFSDWWFAVLTAMDKQFKFNKTDWPTLAMRRLLAPFKRFLFPHDVL